MTPACPLAIDPRIQTLHDRLSELFERKRALPGGDGISIVDTWFEEIGMPLPNLDPEDEVADNTANPDQGTYLSFDEEGPARREPPPTDPAERQRIRIEWSEEVKYEADVTVAEVRGALCEGLYPDTPTDAEALDEINTADPEELAELVKDSEDELDDWLAARADEDFMEVERSIDYVVVNS